MIRKGVNRNGIIYVRARGFDTPSNRKRVESFNDISEESILLDVDFYSLRLKFLRYDLIVLFFFILYE